MKLRISFYSLAVLFCSLFFSEIATAQKIVDKVDISSEDAKVKLFNDSPSSYLVEIGGPDQYYSKQTVDFATEISLSNINTKGEKFKDGLYSLQITPVFTLTEEQREDLSEMRANNDEEGMSAYRKANNLPDFVDVFSMHFSIRNGEFVIPKKQEAKLNLPTRSSQWEINHPSLYASINTIGLDYPDHATDNTAMVDQTFFDDVIVVGSICVGQDCSNGESFGFDTERLKENNLRIHFSDTSTSASFPTNDWRIVVNDSNNGGSNHFSIEDSNTGRTPFRVEAGARANNFVIRSNGNIGLKTLTPVVELHMVDGDSPTVRLEQDGSSGFQSQIWDMVGNETNFFIRDATNGSELPFRIRPGADDNALYINNNNNIGLLTSSPGAPLHIRRADGSTTNFIKIQNAGSIGKTVDIGVNHMVMPYGTTAERPGASTAGLFRYNTDLNKPEYSDGTNWVEFGSGGSGSSVWSTNVDDTYYNTGSVGIGTTTPGSGSAFDTKLEITGSGSGTSGRTDLTITNSDATSAARMTIKNSVGNFFALQASSPSYVTGAAGAFSTVGFDMAFITDANVGSGGTHSIRFQTGGFMSSNERMRIDANGNVGIGCTSPSSRLHVNGTISTTAVSVSTSVACSSDARFKKNISPLQSSLEKVLNLQGVNYDWKIDEYPEKDFNKGQQIGFIAQEIEEVLPLVVQTDAKGYKSVDYSRLTPVLVEAVKEQQKIIDAQQAEIQALQSELSSLEELKSQVAQLTNLVMKQSGADANGGNQAGDE